MILHTDGNSFYASCEQIYRPDLRGKPVAVLSNNDGVIIALNKEAKACGIQRGDPFFKVRDIYNYKGITIFSSNYTLYADISRRITSIYLEYAPDIEEYSIDESFLFFDNCDWSIKDYEEIGYELKYRIYIETLECAIVEYTELAVERLRQQKSECRAIQVMISTCNYYSDKIEEQYSNGIIVQLPRHTSYTPDLVNAARIALPRIYRYGYGYKVVMVTLLDLQPAQFQGYLWIDPMEDIKKKHLMEAVDSITSVYGRRSNTLVKSYVKDGWQMKREFLSPCVTIDFEKIPSVY